MDDAAGGFCENGEGCEDAPKLKMEPVAGPDEVDCCVPEAPASDVPPKLKVGVLPAPKVNGVFEDWEPPLPKSKDGGAELEPSVANGFLIVPSVIPAEKVNEALPPVPKIDPLG